MVFEPLRLWAEPFRELGPLLREQKSVQVPSGLVREQTLQYPGSAIQE